MKLNWKRQSQPKKKKIVKKNKVVLSTPKKQKK